jgi:hypothetical protein
MNRNHSHRRVAPGLAGVLLGGLTLITALGRLAPAASAATSPTISYNYATGMLSGSGFTPGGQVVVRELQGTSVPSSATVTATRPVVNCSSPGHCVQIPGGYILLAVYAPVNLGCAVIETVTVTATDSSTGSVASVPVSFEGMC